MIFHHMKCTSAISCCGSIEAFKDKVYQKDNTIFMRLKTSAPFLSYDSCKQRSQGSNIVESMTRYDQQVQISKISLLTSIQTTPIAADVQLASAQHNVTPDCFLTKSTVYLLPSHVTSIICSSFLKGTTLAGVVTKIGHQSKSLPNFTSHRKSTLFLSEFISVYFQLKLVNINHSGTYYYYVQRLWQNINE